MWPFRKKVAEPEVEVEYRIALPKPKHIEKVFQSELMRLSDNLSEKLSYDVNSDIDDITDAEYDIIGFIDDEVEKLQKIICEKYGHSVTDDHCGKPEHRYCWYCRKAMPGEKVTDYEL